MTRSPCEPEEISGRCEYLTLAFSPSSGTLRSRWRNNGLSADFLGDYVTTFLPTEGLEGSLENSQKAIKHAVSFVANELLENAMKYHQRETNVPIRMHLELKSDQVTVSVSNGATASQARMYEAFIARVRQGNADELLLAQQEQNALNSNEGVSALGLLTMVSDYDAQLDWQFEMNQAVPDSVTVTTIAVLPFKHGSGALA